MTKPSAVPVSSLTIVVMVCLCVLAHCLPSLDSSEEQDTRRVARGRYKMGYMFGKRGDLDGRGKTPTAAFLLGSLMGKAVSVEDLGRLLQTDHTLATRMARHLDTDGDGYVSVRELL
ncbi:hypothetical protein ACOMHN_040230 [Nucella lapillus]